MNDFRRWLLLIEAYQYEMFPPDRLYHTTSPAAAFEILQSRELRPKGDGFVSFSEKPNLHDIEAHGAVIAFDLRKLYAQIEPVEYTEAWAKEHPAEVAYIAGEGWQQQFIYEPDDDVDPDDDDGYEQAYADAEIESFLQKAEEDEWISLHPGQPVRFAPDAVIGLMLDSVDAEDREALTKMGYSHIQLGQA